MHRLSVASVVMACALTGCSATEPSASASASAATPSASALASASTTASESPSASASASASASPSGDGAGPASTCGSASTEEALQSALQQMPTSVGAWSSRSAEVDAFDPCATLSWMVFPIEMGTGSSPTQVAFFHLGEFVGTATEPAIAFLPRVERIDDDAALVTWRYPLEDESNAEASGQAASAFAWDEGAGTFVRVGALPPDAEGAVTGNL